MLNANPVHDQEQHCDHHQHDGQDEQHLPDSPHQPGGPSLRLVYARRHACLLSAVNRLPVVVGRGVAPVIDPAALAVMEAGAEPLSRQSGADVHAVLEAVVGSDATVKVGEAIVDRNAKAGRGALVVPGVHAVAVGDAVLPLIRTPDGAVHDVTELVIIGVVPEAATDSAVRDCSGACDALAPRSTGSGR